MAKIIYGPWRHARASAGFGFSAANSAKSSRVISLRPISAARFTRAAQRGAGMPRGRVRQLLTVESDRASADATSPVPPRASMIEAADMRPTIVRNLRTSQGFATCEPTNSSPHGLIQAMRDAPEVVGKRLAATRLALGYESQKEFADALGLGKSTYNPYEKGTRPLTLQTALLIQDRFHIPINWLLKGDPSQLPLHIYQIVSRAA